MGATKRKINYAKRVGGKQGVKCTCGYFDPFPAYVFAHMNELLVYTCQMCDNAYLLKNGRAHLTGKKPVAH